MNEKLLARLNDTFRRELGEVSPGVPRFKWMHAGECGMWKRVGHQSAGGIVSPRFEFFDMRPQYGDVWLIGTWTEPGSAGAWFTKYGPEIPYPKEGQYFPVGSGAWLPEGHLPSEKATAVAIFELRRQVGLKVEDRLRELRDYKEAKERHEGAIAEDMVYSDWPAFNELPGRKGGTSFQALGTKEENVSNHHLHLPNETDRTPANVSAPERVCD